MFEMKFIIIYIIVCIAIAYIMYCVCEIPYIYKQQKRIALRKALLKNAELYMEPYSDLWKNQKMKCKNLEAELRFQVIYIRDNYRTYKIKTKKRNDIDLYWNVVLSNFSNKISYNEMVEKLTNTNICDKFNVYFDEKEKKEKKLKRNKIDINNCSEMNLTNLSCVNIAVAKRIVKKREEIGGFKSLEDFYNYLKIKPHQKKLIEKEVIIKKIKISKPLKINKERLIDI